MIIKYDGKVYSIPSIDNEEHLSSDYTQLIKLSEDKYIKPVWNSDYTINKFIEVNPCHIAKEIKIPGSSEILEALTKEFYKLKWTYIKLSNSKIKAKLLGNIYISVEVDNSLDFIPVRLETLQYTDDPNENEDFIKDISTILFRFDSSKITNIDELIQFITDLLDTTLNELSGS